MELCEIGHRVKIIKTFDSKDIPLSDILQKIKCGAIQLPDFQRNWVWEDEDITKLLESVSCAYPIGSIMLLQTGNNGVLFSPRPINGLKLDTTSIPELLILDGQQRLTALFQSIISKDVYVYKKNSKKYVPHRYYIDIKKSLQNEEREGCIVSCTESSKKKNNNKKHTKNNDAIEPVFKTEEEQFDQYLFPVSEVLKSLDWRLKFEEHKDNKEEDKKLFSRFENEIIKRFESYHIPIITLDSVISKGAICSVFENVNTSNTQLNAFDLLTAHFATSKIKLREDWEQIKSTILEKYPVLGNIKETDFLQIICLVITYKRGLEKYKEGIKDKIVLSCSRSEVLELTPKEYLDNLDNVKKSFEKVAIFLNNQMIINSSDIPYPSQRIPLTAIYALLRQEDIDKAGTVEKISKWFWCGIFNESYGGRGASSQFAKDVLEVLEWIEENSATPTVVRKSNFHPNKLDDATKNSSALYRGVSVLLVQNGCRDFISGYPINIHKDFNNGIHVHHIFSKNWCIQHKIPESRRDSIINKTPLTSATNTSISDAVPSDYISKIQENDKGLDENKINEIFLSHLIEPKSIRHNNFNGFYNARKKKIVEQIAKVTGKQVSDFSFT